MLSLILVAALNVAAPPADKPPQRMAGSGCTPTTLQLVADGPLPAQPAPCPKPYLMAWPHGQDPVLPPQSERTPNFYRQPVRCGPVADEITRRIATASGGRRPAAIYAVDRRVDGCALPTPINYHPDYLLPGAADPVRRGDAPADRR